MKIEIDSEKLIIGSLIVAVILLIGIPTYDILASRPTKEAEGTIVSLGYVQSSVGTGVGSNGRVVITQNHSQSNVIIEVEGINVAIDDSDFFKHAKIGEKVKMVYHKGGLFGGRWKAVW